MLFFLRKKSLPWRFSWGLVFINAFKVEQLPEAEISSKGSPLRPPYFVADDWVPDETGKEDAFVVEIPI